MVDPSEFYYCGREIPSGEKHYVLDRKHEWYVGCYTSLLSYCAYQSPDKFKTCEMCDTCAARNGIIW